MFDQAQSLESTACSSESYSVQSRPFNAAIPRSENTEPESSISPNVLFTLDSELQDIPKIWLVELMCVHDLDFNTSNELVSDEITCN